MTIAVAAGSRSAAGHRRAAARGAGSDAAPGGPAHRRGAARPARSADEPDPVGPGAHRPLRGAVAHPQPRRADRVRRDAGAVQPVRASPQRAGRPAAAGPGRCPARSWTRSGAGCSAAWRSPISTRANPLLRDGYVYQMVLQHEYQHNETILQTLQLKQGAPYSPRGRASMPPAAPTARRRSRARWCASPAARSRSAPTTAPPPTTTSGRATRWSWLRSGSTSTR